MSDLVFQTKAVKVVNKGGGHITKTIKEERKTPTGRILSRHRHIESIDRIAGSDYVVFNCKRCGARNKRCVYEVKASTADGALSFKCNRCRTENEVSRPHPGIIVPGQIEKKPAGGIVLAR